MDFSFAEKDLAFAAEARAWLEANVPPAWRRDHAWTRAEDPMWLTIAREWQRKLFDGGWAAISWPRDLGGRGATVIERWLFEEELDRIGAPRPIASSGAVDLIGSALLKHGTDAQQRRFIRPLLAADDLWCQGFSEPGAGSDLAGLRTRGERDGDQFVVNGQKVWTSHADIADWCFLLCRTELDQPKHKGISLLLVDMKTPGISVRPLKQATGDAEFSEVFFDNVRVPADLMIGAPGAGWQIAMGILAHERGPVWTFTFQRRIRRSLEHLVRIARHQGNGLGDALTRQRLAQAHIEVELLRLVGYRSLTRLLRTGQPGVESSIEKILGSETDQRLQELAMAVLGPYGSIGDDPRDLDALAIERDYLYSRSETIMGGTSEIQRNVIAQRMLGLPR
ncbi:MAG: acyl-CoA dehydrogenase family protein [Deltaproteobacteria bacterium]|nr:acyl-CoA dehydrogenase family protein [Deltaproteobacteria bacterium]MBI3389535.1 acyl-CoA dehydrogenase family protein [Deltaproteobacteria bacterium]